MARIAGVDIPNNKRIATSLTYIFGIGPHRAREICAKTKIDPEIKTRDLTEEQTRSIIGILDKEYQVEGTLRTEIAMNIQRLMDIGCYRGLRWRRGLDRPYRRDLVRRHRMWYDCNFRLGDGAPPVRGRRRGERTCRRYSCRQHDVLIEISTS